MQDNAQNNWKHLLENADDLPAEVLKDKNDAWEKLYVRLHKKSRHKLLPWYWAAASFVIISITTFILFRNKKMPSTVTVSSPANYPAAIPTKKALVTTEQKKNTTLFSPLEKNGSVSLTKKNTSAKGNEIINNHDLITDSAKEQTVMETAIEPVLHFDSSAKETVNAAPAKKKLRVIHINDIGQPMEESTADNQFIQRDRFKLRILNNENFNPVSTSPARNGLIPFKSRNASN